ncbi:MAG: uridine monophosphate kinase [Deltaproteobacteria bacterium]|nr:uridine monophosphate kinase [Deltaproteobacteria bacterium]
MDEPAPRRILLKLSGGYLGDRGLPLDRGRLDRVAAQLVPLIGRGVGVGLVTGGGNVLRGGSDQALGFPRTSLDRMGMMVTVVNGLALAEALAAAGLRAGVFSTFPVGLEGIHPFSSEAVDALLEEGGVPVFAGGTGLPFFSTDTAAVIRGLQIRADLLVKGSRVDGIYDRDPERHPGAQRFDRIDSREVIERGLEVMDQAAFALARRHRLPIVVLDIATPGILAALLDGTAVCTRVEHAEEEDHG